jgi:hypothetical protein
MYLFKTNTRPRAHPLRARRRVVYDACCRAPRRVLRALCPCCFFAPRIQDLAPLFPHTTPFVDYYR